MKTELCRENAIRQWRTSLNRKDLSDEDRVLGAIEAYERQKLACDLRATPSPVPELVRYHISGDQEGECKHGKYALHSEADRIISDQAKELRAYMNSAESYMVDVIRQTERAEAAEAKIADLAKEITSRDITIKDLQTRNDMLLERWEEQGKTIEGLKDKLAEIEKQVPLGWISVCEFDGLKAGTYAERSVARVRSKVKCIPLYAHPVADREAEISIKWLISAVSKMIADDVKFEGHIPLATIQKVYGAHSDCVRALSGKEPAASPLTPEGGRE